MPTKLIDLGKTYPSPEAAMPKSEKGKKHYSCIYLEGDNLPDIPTDGSEFYFIGKGRVAGMRNPTDGKPSMDMEVMGMAPIPHNQAAKLVSESSSDEEPKSLTRGMKGFRDTMSDIAGGTDDGESEAEDENY